MLMLRKHAIEISKKAKKYGLILGTLGRQGSSKVLEVLLLLLMTDKPKNDLKINKYFACIIKNRYIFISYIAFRRKNQIKWIGLCLCFTLGDIS